MRMAYKQLAEFGDNFKDCLHKPTFREDGLHAPMEADNFKDGLTASVLLGLGAQ